MLLAPQLSQLEHKVPPGKGSSAAMLLPCAKINNFKCKSLRWPVAVIVVNILAAPRTFQRGHAVLTQERRYKSVLLPAPRNTLSRHVI